ncbi:MAG TPA: YdcH family protein [Thermoanaerobaculia bacterium]|nr:YdcH family protein [Thermoanaerobaculia bacterium]
MSNRVADIQQILSTEDVEFRQWVEEHHACESRLSELASKPQVTIEEEMEEKTLKKRKLHLKDQMAARIRTYESSNSVA